MNWNPLQILGLVEQGMDIADQFVTDKDKREELKHTLSMMKEQVYLAELGTTTVPWVDALHKMGRQIISMVSILGGGVLLHFNPDVGLEQLAAVLAPGGIYNYIKGRGK